MVEGTFFCNIKYSKKYYLKPALAMKRVQQLKGFDDWYKSEKYQDINFLLKHEFI